MRSGFVSATLASSVVFSSLLSGCATTSSQTSPASSNSLQQNLAILKTALNVASRQKYTQIAASGASSAGNPTGPTLGVPSDIHQTIDVDGSTSVVNQDSAPSIYKTQNHLFAVWAGKWKEFTPNQPSAPVSGEKSALQNITASQLRLYFQTFSAKDEGAQTLIFTLVPAARYRDGFLKTVSQDLHRVMIGQDPYDWTMLFDNFNNRSVDLRGEKLVLTLTRQGTAWMPTSAIWNLDYTNRGRPAAIHLHESYTRRSFPVKIPANVVGGDVVAPMTSKVTHPDGQIISLTPINALSIPNFYTSLDAYTMTYWSQNIPVVAYTAVPHQSGTYPLYVICHGGWITTPSPITHILSLGSIPFDSTTALAFAPKDGITLAPMYRGYGASQGLVAGLAENARDTINAMKAIESKYKIETGHIYLQGGSMGGGVVLKVASELDGIRSVIAVSPYLGANWLGSWYLTHQQSAISNINTSYTKLTEAYGRFDPNKQIYREESIDYSKIQAPTLLLQGTGDQRVQWQAVQAFYNEMKAGHKRVEFDLVKHADHGFTGSYGFYLHDAITLWYAKYGESAP